MTSGSSSKKIPEIETKTKTKTKEAEIKEQYERIMGRKILFIIFSLFLMVLIAGVSPTIGSADISVSDTYIAILHKFSPDHFNSDPKEIRYLFSVDNRLGLEEDLNKGILPEELKEGIEDKGKRLSERVSITKEKEEDNKWVIRDEEKKQEYIVRGIEGDGKLNIYDALESEKIVKIVWQRLSRTVMGILAGIGLAIAGTTMQGALRNPFASPFTLGVASTAAFGAMLGGSFGGGRYLMVITAFIFAFLPFLLFHRLSKYRSASPETMILVGIALVFTFFPLSFLAGISNIGGKSWDVLFFVSIVIAICILFLVLKSWDLNTLSVGDETAKSLGINVGRTRVVCLAFASLATAVIVCFTGIIAFIGLVAPHLCRMVIGSDNRFLILTSGFLGASLLLGLDGIGRTIMAPMAMPVGVLAMFMGGPLLFYFAIRRRRKEYW